MNPPRPNLSDLKSPIICRKTFLMYVQKVCQFADFEAIKLRNIRSGLSRWNHNGIVFSPHLFWASLSFLSARQILSPNSLLSPSNLSILLCACASRACCRSCANATADLLLLPLSLGNPRRRGSTGPDEAAAEPLRSTCSKRPC